MVDVIGIIGSGPRALSVAICANREGKKVYLIDRAPLSAWRYPNIIPGITMRSPISFDLVSFLDESFSDWRLDNYLGCPYSYTTQQEIEACPHPVNRDQFLSYLEHSLAKLKSRGVIHIPQNAMSIGEGWIRLEDKEILRVDRIVVATGSNSLAKMPVWINKTELYSKLVTKAKCLEGNIKGSSFIVVGSGQAAAEYAAQLSISNDVYWAISKDYKITQYPAPVYEDWGPKSALGPYYRSFYGDNSLQENYLKQVKAWQPSITQPVLDQLEDVEIINPSSIRDIAPIADKVEHIVVFTGTRPSLSSNPLFNDIQKLDSDRNFPLLMKGFRTPNSIYFTGVLAVRYDGPRQASVISAGLTAKEILEDMNK